LRHEGSKAAVGLVVSLFVCKAAGHDLLVNQELHVLVDSIDLQVRQLVGVVWIAETGDDCILVALLVLLEEEVKIDWVDQGLVIVDVHVEQD